MEKNIKKKGNQRLPLFFKHCIKDTIARLVSYTSPAMLIHPHTLT